MADDVLPDPDIAALARELGVTPAMVTTISQRLAPRTAPTETPAGTPLPPPEPRPPERYRLEGALGAGGMGEVRRAHDTLLDRTVAMKIAHETDPDGEAFLAEARIAARLQHPGILPVYESGAFDGRRWLTMREIDGRRLTDLIVRDASPTALRRLIAVFARVCETVAFAHAAGIVHLDLKPSNIMVGRFGEVIVLDWGIARRIGEPTRSSDGILGTDGYMSPQHADGDAAAPGHDVFALGRILGRILGTHPEGDPELTALAEGCVAPDPASRPANADVVREAVTSWLDGARRRAEAQTLVDEAHAIAARIERLAREADIAEDRAHALLGDLPTHAPVDDKAPGWAFEDAARALRREAATARVDFEQRLQAALIRAPDLAEAREALGDAYRDRVLDAEAARDPHALAEAEARLRAMGDPRHDAFLAGDGRLSLTTDPPGAAVWCAPYVTERRRLVPGAETLLGTTPLRAVPLAKGSHRLRIEHSGCVPVIHAISLERGEHWDSRPPDAATDAIGCVPLPRLDEQPPGTCYVPPGWCWCGGDSQAVDPMPRRRIWIDGFFIERDPLTYATLVPALNAMVEAGRSDLADVIAPPPADPGGGGSDGDLSIDRIGEHYRLDLRHPDASADWPVTHLDWHAATAWAHWRAERSGLPWRLPHDLEREKAARGADGRHMPWGDHFDPTWASVQGGREGTPRRTPVGHPAEDISPYGVRGLAGNAKDWCLNGYHRLGLPRGVRRLALGAPSDGENTRWRMQRGGSYAAKPEICRAASRFASPPHARLWSGGVRLVCPQPVSRDQSAES